MATIRITNPAGVFLGSNTVYQYGTLGGTTLVSLIDGVTSAVGDGQYEVNLVKNELQVYGSGVNGLNLHVVKLANGLPSPYDTRVLKICAVVVINGNVAGVRDTRVNGGIGANNVPPGALPADVLDPATFQLQYLTDVNVTDATTTDGYVLTWSHSSGKWVAAAAGGGGGGLSVPQVAQSKFAGTAISSLTLDIAPANGHTLLLFLDMYNTGTATAVSSTNTTWTKIKTFTSGGSAIYDLWVGIVSGTGGTVITITHPNAFCSAVAVETTASVTPTLGANSTFNTSNSTFGLSGVGIGHLVAVCAGCDNTTQTLQNIPTMPGSGTQTGIVTLALLFATASAVYTALSAPGGGLLIAELT